MHFCSSSSNNNSSAPSVYCSNNSIKFSVIIHLRLSVFSLRLFFVGSLFRCIF